MTLDYVENLLAVLNLEKKARGGENEIDFVLNTPEGKKTVRLKVDEAIKTFSALRLQMLKEEDELEQD